MGTTYSVTVSNYTPTLAEINKYIKDLELEIKLGTSYCDMENDNRYYGVIICVKKGLDTSAGNYGKYFKSTFYRATERYDKLIETLSEFFQMDKYDIENNLHWNSIINVVKENEFMTHIVVNKSHTYAYNLCHVNGMKYSGMLEENPIEKSKDSELNLHRF